ncbi:MAG TPA: hypothetical protein VEQ59_07895 [Polyangiaceae bacterium]|nr:hypothetical protein [Polyangiaceae bacterium]
MNDQLSTITQDKPQEAADANPLDRPGVPQEIDPQPQADAHWLTPDQQASEPPPMIGHGRPLTPVYSTVNRARGLSGLVRRAAYRVPDYRPKRWALLVLADRIDVLEHNPTKLLGAVARVGLVGLGIYGLLKLRPRRAWA